MSDLSEDEATRLACAIEEIGGSKAKALLEAADSTDPCRVQATDRRDRFDAARRRRAARQGQRRTCARLISGRSIAFTARRSVDCQSRAALLCGRWRFSRDNAHAACRRRQDKGSIGPERTGAASPTPSWRAGRFCSCKLCAREPSAAAAASKRGTDGCSLAAERGRNFAAQVRMWRIGRHFGRVRGLSGQERKLANWVP